jgi:hypothetical protein
MYQKILIVILIIIILLLSYNVKVLMNKNLEETFDGEIPTDLKPIHEFSKELESNIATSETTGNLSPEQLKANEKLLDEIKNINISLKLLIEKQKSSSIEGSLSQESASDINVSQQEQSKYIENLKTRLSNLQKIYATHLQKQTQQSQNIKYDKIPVYSSCIVAEANGQYTLPPL